MKKRIFIAIHYMEIGGAEMSLIGLLSAIDYNIYDVDLFIYSHQGEFMELIPKEVNILSQSNRYASIEKPMTTIIKQGQLDIIAARLLAKLQFRYYTHANNIKNSAAIFQYVADTTTPLLPSLQHLGKYDLAISFMAPHNIVRYKVLAKKKIAWIHTDYTQIEINARKELPVWDAYDYIASISDDVSTTFCKIFPSLQKKITLIENILSPDFVRARAEEQIDLSEIPIVEGEIKLLSVGRYSSPKNFDNVPDIACKLRALGLHFCWYIIGYGGDEELIKSKIEEAHMEEHVVLLGKKSNPYPYMKACDVYIQPSRYEGKSVTVREAQMLHKPVIVTNYPTASSQIKHELDGVIVPLENSGCAQGIYDFIADKDLQTTIIAYLKENDFGNEKEIQKIYNLIET